VFRLGHIFHSTIGFCAASPSPAVYLSGYYHYNHTAGILSQNPRATHLDPKTFPLHFFFGGIKHPPIIHPPRFKELPKTGGRDSKNLRSACSASPPHISLALQKNPTECHRRHWGSVSRTYLQGYILFSISPDFFSSQKTGRQLGTTGVGITPLERKHFA